MVKYNRRISSGYGLTSPLPDVFPSPIRANRAPTAGDNGHEIGQVWINILAGSTTHNDIWMLSHVAGGVANWEPIGNDTGGAAPITKYVVDADGTGDFTTVQAALDAANALAPDAVIYVRPGTYTENLTLYDGMTVVADGYDSIITGVHTPPAAGTFEFRNISLTSATDIMTSAVAGTAEIAFEGCLLNCTNGYIFDCANWTGPLFITLCGTASTADGIARIGAAAVTIGDSQVGAGATALAITGGSLTIYDSVITNPITTAGACAFVANRGAVFNGLITTGGTATTALTNCTLDNGATAVISHGSAGVFSLNECTINSSNATPIGGAGAGTLTLGNVDFVQNSAIAGTVTVAYNRTTNRISPYIVGPTGNYQTIQAALDAANASGVANAVYVQSGTYTEDLTLYPSIDLVGSNINTCVIVGVHTPPATGEFNIRNFTLNSNTSIFSSAVAGSAYLFIENCYGNVTNGYIFDVLNWTGDLGIDNSEVLGTTNGVINNTGGSAVVLSAFGGGAGAATCTMSGNLILEICEINVPCTIQGAGTSTCREGVFFGGTLTIAGTATVTMDQANIASGATPAITMSSANAVTITNSTINSSNATPIGGAGAGTLTLGSVDFIQNSAIAGTVTLAYTRATDRNTPFVVGATGNYQTIQAALTAADAIGPDTEIYVQAGTYTEDLTLYDGQTIRGSGLDTIITGTHTPPAAGTVSFVDMQMTDAVDIFNSAAAGTTQIILNNILVNCTNGFTFNLLNWTGAITMLDCAEASTANGVLSNTGGVTLNLWNTVTGAGANVLAITGGALNIFNSRVINPITTAGACTVHATGSYFNAIFTTGGTTNTQINGCYFESLLTPVISHGSAGILQITNTLVESTASPPIVGAGGGSVYLSGVQFVAEAGLAATLTLNHSASTRSTKLLCGDSTYRVNLFTADNNVIQTYATDATATGAATRNAIRGDLNITSGDGNHSPDCINSLLTAASGSNLLQGLSTHGEAVQADGSTIASTLVGVEGRITINETDAADIPQIYAFGVKGYYRTDDAAAVPLTGEYAAIGAVTEYTTPLNAYGYGVVSTRLGAGAGTAARAAFGVAQGTQAIADWLYGLDLYNTVPANAGVAYTNADIRLWNQATIASAAAGITITSVAGDDIDIVLGDAAGANNFALQSSTPADIFVVDSTGNTTIEGNLDINAQGHGIFIAEGGAAAYMGTATLAGGTITVNTTAVTANSRIFLTPQGVLAGVVYISARVAGTSFTITSTNGADTPAVAWMIVEPS
jgi:hypothetical protein